MSAVLLRHPRSLLRRLAVALLLLGVVAQMFAHQANTGHLAGMLSARWLWSDVCSTAPDGVVASVLAEFDHRSGDADDDAGRHVLAHCPLCVLGVLPMLAARGAPEVPPVPAGERLHRLPARPPWTPASTAHLLPPSQGPPAV